MQNTEKWQITDTKTYINLRSRIESKSSPNINCVHRSHAKSMFSFSGQFQVPSWDRFKTEMKGKRWHSRSTCEAQNTRKNAWCWHVYRQHLEWTQTWPKYMVWQSGRISPTVKTISGLMHKNRCKALKGRPVGSICNSFRPNLTDSIRVMTKKLIEGHD